MFNRPDKNVNKSTRDRAERIYWVTCTIDALGAASGASPLQAVSGGERFPVPMWEPTTVQIRYGSGKAGKDTT